jgi:RimJ/RimL family protein N-acetyltransferase
MSALPHPDPPLRDGEIFLRPFQPGDEHVLSSWGQDETILRWTGVPRGNPPEFAAARAKSNEQARLDGTAIVLLITDNEEVVGSCDIRIPTPGVGEIGYLISHKGRGRGIGYTAVTMMSEWALNTLPIEYIQALVHPNNTASIRLLEKMGYKKDRLLVGYRDDPNDDGDRIRYLLY